MIWKALLTKTGLPIIAAIGIFAGGIFTQKKFLTRECPDCVPPACNCPAPSVSVQPFDVDKIKNLKAFTYSPQFTGAISVAGVDSVAIKRYIEEAVMRAISQEGKKKRKGLFSMNQVDSLITVRLDNHGTAVTPGYEFTNPDLYIPLPQDLSLSLPNYEN